MFSEILSSHVTHLFSNTWIPLSASASPRATRVEQDRYYQGLYIWITDNRLITQYDLSTVH